MPRIAKSALAVVLVAVFTLAVFAAPAQAAGPGSQLGQERTAWLDLGFTGWLQQVLDAIFGSAPTTTVEESDTPTRLFDKARVDFDPNGVNEAGTSPTPEAGSD